MSKVHRKGRVQLVKLKGLMGRNLIFGSLYAPTESEEGDDTKRDVFWDGVHEAVNEIGCTERDIVTFGIDNNGETGECEVPVEEENEKENEEKREETRSKLSKSRILTLLVGKLIKITKSLIFPSQY